MHAAEQTVREDYRRDHLRYRLLLDPRSHPDFYAENRRINPPPRIEFHWILTDVLPYNFQISLQQLLDDPWRLDVMANGNRFTGQQKNDALAALIEITQAYEQAIFYARNLIVKQTDDDDPSEFATHLLEALASAGKMRERLMEQLESVDPDELTNRHPNCLCQYLVLLDHHLLSLLPIAELLPQSSDVGRQLSAEVQTNIDDLSNAFSALDATYPEFALLLRQTLHETVQGDQGTHADLSYNWFMRVKSVLWEQRLDDRPAFKPGQVQWQAQQSSDADRLDEKALEVKAVKRNDSQEASVQRYLLLGYQGKQLSSQLVTCINDLPASLPEFIQMTLLLDAWVAKYYHGNYDAFFRKYPLPAGWDPIARSVLESLHAATGSDFQLPIPDPTAKAEVLTALQHLFPMLMRVPELMQEERKQAPKKPPNVADIPHQLGEEIAHLPSTEFYRTWKTISASSLSGFWGFFKNLFNTRSRQTEIIDRHLKIYRDAINRGVLEMGQSEQTFQNLTFEAQMALLPELDDLLAKIEIWQESRNETHHRWAAMSDLQQRLRADRAAFEQNFQRTKQQFRGMAANATAQVVDAQAGIKKASVWAKLLGKFGKYSSNLIIRSAQV